MEIPIIFILCCLAGISQGVVLKADRPFLRVQLSNPAKLYCCYSEGDEVTPTWTRNDGFNHSINMDRVTMNTSQSGDERCGILTFQPVQLNDTGMYWCTLSGNENTHGTYLQVYQPMKKTINLSESTKNNILTAEGVLLLLCVLLPSFTLLLKSKRLHNLEKKKMKREEENIYQGLNLDECCTTYDQIERSQAHGPYQDVGNIMEEREDIQLEKP
ncbi:B-cell antigen receptor complex-associated protein alpha chain [Parambassis ranga]|uniref:B-cell antigen receptor complex-associated protein alpha chain n=1 Tax=Parambassis ranga TaxID=210632 RepID=A0A6P7K3B0_9TELE|nr:B-cell antigen receptor complex-associated protein alpha chain [Parambassis ranga]